MSAAEAQADVAPVEVSAPPPERAPPFGGALKAQVGQLSELVAAQGRAIDLLTTAVSQQVQEISELRSQLGRLATSLGRQDVMTPPATVEQLREAYKAGRSLLVLKDCKLPGGVSFISGTKVEARQYDLDRMCELVSMGSLAVAVVE